jgi:glycosyltransferase involved in cell wall biosynthesis
MLVIGDGPARAGLQREAQTLGLEDRVHFPGWVTHDELPRFWRAADLGLLPFHKCSHIETTLANKLFDYMAVGLPVLASDAAPMVRVLRETGAGATFRAGCPEDFDRVVTRLLHDPKCQTRNGGARSQRRPRNL